MNVHFPGHGRYGLKGGIRGGDWPHLHPSRATLADQEDLKLRFDVLTKTKKPELHRYWTARNRAANLRLFLGVVQLGSGLRIDLLPLASVA
ncbi:MAG TPA: hypothetical protein VJO34_05385 [Methylomirabilota bacterium]|nr:hypothetical protein [Methylomirabilota bacterium]